MVPHRLSGAPYLAVGTAALVRVAAGARAAAGGRHLGLGDRVYLVSNLQLECDVAQVAVDEEEEGESGWEERSLSRPAAGGVQTPGMRDHT